MRKPVDRQKTVTIPKSDYETTRRKGHLLPKKFQRAQPVYDAVGRIGERQIGFPSGEEKILGTGILISNSHILTNHHVAASIPFGQNFTGIGIDFGAEKGSEVSDFVEIDDVGAIPISEYDAAILTLKFSTDRKPVNMCSRPLEELMDQEILAIGYPSRPDNERPNLILGAKRYSQGKIFKHSTDFDRDITVSREAYPSVGEDIVMNVICHSASTLKGSSGSAIVDANSGDLIALHFGGDSLFGYKEAANFAIPGALIVDKINSIIGK